MRVFNALKTLLNRRFQSNLKAFPSILSFLCGFSEKTINLPTYFKKPGSMGIKAFRVNIIGLSNSVHEFQFEIGDEFFKQYGTGLISEGSRFDATVTLDKRETLIEARFVIKGMAKLICDRSLDPFDYPIKADRKIVFKYGEKDEELSDEIMIIQRDTDSLELGQFIYEFINLEVPIKKLHPRYAGELDDDAEGKIIYTSGSNEGGDDEDNIDPRWEILKKLK
jgi:uncharacterized protein